MRKIMQFIFWTTLLLFLAVLISVPYVGVYLTYVAIPVIVVSGVIVRLTKPKSPKKPSAVENFFSEAKDFFAAEAADAREMLEEETKVLEQWKQEREAEKALAAVRKASKT